MSYTCYNCFQEKPNNGACPFCGYDQSIYEGKYPSALQQGSILNGKYIVGRVLGQGGFGITYIAKDYKTGERVAIKEYLPSEFAGRNGNSVQPYSGDHEANFAYGKEQFLTEAKTLAAFIGDEHIVRIYSFFEENNTAYFAMEYVDGLALDKYMAQQGGRLTVAEANRLLLPLMESLNKVHRKGIVHRDISPDNIIVTKEGSVKLIDFGAARYSTGEKSRSLDVILKHGFAPPEQYMRRGRQGPFTDVYALAATYYYAITGKLLPDSVERTFEDTIMLPRALGVKISRKQEDVLLKALEVNAAGRYQNMGEFYREMVQVSGIKTEATSSKQQTNIGSSPALSQTEQEALKEAERYELIAKEAREKAKRLEQERQEQERREKEARKQAEKQERESRAREESERRKQEKLLKKQKAQAEKTQKQAESSTLPKKTKGPILVAIVTILCLAFIVLTAKMILPNVRNNQKQDTEEIISMKPDETETALNPENDTGDFEQLIDESLEQYETEEARESRGSPYMGIYPDNRYNSDYCQYYKFPHGVYVNSVIEGSAADKAGLEVGDIITKLGGYVLEDYTHWKGAIDHFCAGDTVEMTVLRSDEELRLSITFDQSAPEIISELKLLSDESVGDYVQFGSYEQDNDSSNGKEPIEWLILDVKDNKALLLSRYVLDCQPYNIKDTDVTWETCSLRSWLNKMFLEAAFSSEEQAKITAVMVSADKNSYYNTDPGNSTTDQVFLLSEPEVNHYFSSDTARMCKPTVYAKYYKDKENETYWYHWWWLRSPGGLSNCAALVINGSVRNYGSIVDNICAVRPALWIDLDKAGTEEPSADSEQVSDDSVSTSPHETEALKEVSAGDYVLFGNYEQDNDLTNGKEPIEWLVIDVKENRALLLSHYALDSQKFHSKRDTVTWETCTLRNWLNSSFLSSAFNADEQAMIPTVSVTADKNPDAATNPGKSTEDQIFLLSIIEAEKYFQSSDERQCIPTPYALAHGCRVHSQTGICSWWLRTPGKNGMSMETAFVNYNSNISSYGETATYINAVRPALWIDLDKAG